MPGQAGALVGLATEADMEEFAALQWAAFEPALHEPLDVLTQDVLRATTWLVRDAGRLIGSVRCEVHADLAHFSLVMVAPDRQGRGLGRAMMRYAEAAAPPQVTAYQLFTAAGDVPFYTRLGYVVDGGRDDHDVGVVRMGRDR